MARHPGPRTVPVAGWCPKLERVIDSRHDGDRVIPGAIVVSEVKMCRELEGTETALTTPGDSHTECGPVRREPSLISAR